MLCRKISFFDIFTHWVQWHLWTLDTRGGKLTSKLLSSSSFDSQIEYLGAVRKYNLKSFTKKEARKSECNRLRQSAAQCAQNSPATFQQQTKVKFALISSTARTHLFCISRRSHKHAQTHVAAAAALCSGASAAKRERAAALFIFIYYKMYAPRAKQTHKSVQLLCVLCYRLNGFLGSSSLFLCVVRAPRGSRWWRDSSSAALLGRAVQVFARAP